MGNCGSDFQPILTKFFPGTNNESPSSTSDSNVKSEIDNNNIDIGLVIKLQNKLAEVEREKMRIQKRLDELDMSPRTERYV